MIQKCRGMLGTHVVVGAVEWMVFTSVTLRVVSGVVVLVADGVV